jgi:nucleoside-diphosphate-sugar epimerase
VRHHRNAIEAAKAAGARRVVYTSHMGSSTDSLFVPLQDHAATEPFLALARIYSAHCATESMRIRGSWLSALL